MHMNGVLFIKAWESGSRLMMGKPCLGPAQVGIGSAFVSFLGELSEKKLTFFWELCSYLCCWHLDAADAFWALQYSAAPCSKTHPGTREDFNPCCPQTTETLMRIDSNKKKAGQEYWYLVWSSRVLFYVLIQFALARRFDLLCSTIHGKKSHHKSVGLFSQLIMHGIASLGPLSPAAWYFLRTWGQQRNRLAPKVALSC